MVMLLLCRGNPFTETAVASNKVDEIAFERLKSFVWDNKRKVRIL